MTEEESRVYQEIIQRLQELIEQDKLIQSLEEKLTGGTATYQDAWDYANRVGRATSTAMTEQIDALISDGIDGYETIMEALYEGYDTSAVYAAAVQTIQNKRAGLGIKGQQADFDRDRASGIAHLGSNAEDAASAARYLGTPVEHFTENVVGDTIKANETFQYQSGLNPKIKRTSSGKCCQWCDEIAGVYDYPAPDEVYRRHQNCNCLVEYYPGNGLKQNVHSKRWTSENRKEENKAYALRGPSRAEMETRARAGESDPNNRGIIAGKILNGEYPLRIRHQKYLQHIKGTAQYRQATRDRGREQSYLTITEEEAQAIVYSYAGKGRLSEIKNGNYVDDREYITVNRTIGKYLEKGEWYDTDRLMIMYAKKGTHIVPVKKKYERE